jgi:hypothetical protein
VELTVATGTVNATSLNLRAAPDGAVLAALPFGARLTITNDAGDWLEVSAGARTGFVASRYVTRAGAAAAPVVPPRDNGQIQDDGNYAYTPLGQRFATKCGPGFRTSGTTSMASFVTAAGARFAALAPSLLRVMRAVSANEGNLEAINSYDNAFLSVGLFQWTAGTDGNPGELAGLLDRVRGVAPAVFAEYFGSFGLNAVVAPAQPGRLVSGLLEIDGAQLTSGAAKAVLRSAVWAYRFWRAGNDDTVRQAQVEHAAARVATFYDASIGTRKVRDYVTSEYGVALLLDEHVNRPGHVPGTLANAVAVFVQSTGRADPGTWNDADEAQLLQSYLSERVSTSMTNSDARAQSIAASGLAATARGSFQT